MDIPSLIRPYAELLYFFGGITLAVTAIIALNQLLIAKKSLNVQSSRDALKLTASECANYFDKIIPLVNDFDKAINDENIIFFKGLNVELSDSHLKLKAPEKVIVQNLEKAANTLVPLCNSLEGFATYFISGVADEYVAYHSVGTTFLRAMDTLIPWVAYCTEDGYYNNLFHLYVKWKRRKEKYLLCQKKETIEKQLSQMSDERSFPIGVDTE